MQDISLGCQCGHVAVLQSELANARSENDALMTESLEKDDELEELMGRLSRATRGSQVSLTFVRVFLVGEAEDPIGYAKFLLKDPGLIPALCAPPKRFSGSPDGQ